MENQTEKKMENDMETTIDMVLVGFWRQSILYTCTDYALTMLVMVLGFCRLAWGWALRV